MQLPVLGHTVKLASRQTGSVHGYKTRVTTSASYLTPSSHTSFCANAHEESRLQPNSARTDMHFSKRKQLKMSWFDSHPLLTKNILPQFTRPATHSTAEVQSLRALQPLTGSLLRTGTEFGASPGEPAVSGASPGTTRSRGLPGARGRGAPTGGAQPAEPPPEGHRRGASYSSQALLGTQEGRQSKTQKSPPPTSCRGVRMKQGTCAGPCALFPLAPEPSVTRKQGAPGPFTEVRDSSAP